MVILILRDLVVGVGLEITVVITSLVFNYLEVFLIVS